MIGFFLIIVKLKKKRIDKGPGSVKIQIKNQDTYPQYLYPDRCFFRICVLCASLFSSSVLNISLAALLIWTKACLFVFYLDTYRAKNGFKIVVNTGVTWVLVREHADPANLVHGSWWSMILYFICFLSSIILLRPPRPRSFHAGIFEKRKIYWKTIIKRP